MASLLGLAHAYFGRELARSLLNGIHFVPHSGPLMALTGLEFHLHHHDCFVARGFKLQLPVGRHPQAMLSNATGASLHLILVHPRGTRGRSDI